MKTGLLCSGICIALMLIATFAISISSNNEERQLRNLAEAQRSVVETQLDNTAKVLQQKAQVVGNYTDEFKNIFIGVMEGRYGKDDNTLMKWIQESNPNFDSSMYKDLMATIEIKQTEFMNAQNRMIDIIREHKNLLITEPNSWFISNKTPIEYKVVSMTSTKKAMETGVDDNIDLFKK